LLPFPLNSANNNAIAPHGQFAGYIYLNLTNAVANACEYKPIAKWGALLPEIDTWLFFKWIFKTFIAVLILSNTFNIVMGVFDVSQSVVNSAAGLIGSSTNVPADMRQP
jgi:hypothetical protein